MKICIVSPHLDDALLSCGILIQRHKARSDEILSLNIFTAGTNSENRKKEDRNAAEKIGALPFFLDELDAPDRNPLYQSTIKIFFGPIEDVPEHYIQKVTQIVNDFLMQHKIDVAYFPLAAGTHIDHRIAFTAGMRIKNTRVRFYEDRPYILWPGVLQGRMNQIGSDAALPPVTARMMQETLHSYHYLKHFVPEGEYQKACLPLYYAAAEQKSARTLTAASETLVATEKETKKLFDCLNLYESQMKFIFPDYETFIRDSLSYERVNSGKSVYAERSWSFKPAA